MRQYKPASNYRKIPSRFLAEEKTARQYELALDAAPDRVKAHGLRAAHPRPLVSVGKRAGRVFTSWRTSPEKAWRFPEVEYASAGSSWAALIFDCDDRRRWGVGLGDLPAPNWIVRRRENDHAHIAWCLAQPVHRYPLAEIDPLEYLSWIAGYYTSALGADAGYNGVLAHNPAPRYRQGEFVTEWGSREPYSLDALGSVIPFGWSPPAPTVGSGIGRNVDLYTSGMRWAGRKKHADLDVLPALIVANQQFDVPLPASEVASMAASIERSRRRWAARGWHQPAWIERQAERGRLGGLASGQVRRPGSAAETRPWEAAGVSRATWRRQQGEPGRAPGRPCRFSAGQEPWVLAGISRATWYRHRALALAQKTGETKLETRSQRR